MVWRSYLKFCFVISKHQPIPLICQKCLNFEAHSLENLNGLPRVCANANFMITKNLHQSVNFVDIGQGKFVDCAEK